MKLILSNEYRLESIPLNYVLIKTNLSYGNANNKTDTPKLVESVVGYYPTIYSAIKRYIDNVVKDQTEDFNGNPEEYLNRLENIFENTIDKQVKVVMDAIEKEKKWK